MKRRVLAWSSIFVFIALVWGGYRAWRAHGNLVTLSVRNMDVREVIRKIEWQTWERIIVHNEVRGKVTLNVKDAQLGDVLNIVGDQTSSRWTALYPIYRKGSSLVEFKKVARGDLPVASSGWTNLQMRGGFGPGGPGPGGPGPGGMFGANARSQNDTVNLQLQKRDLAFATLALSRFSQAQVVPENGAEGTITLHLRQARFEKAVAGVARQVNRKWDQLYALQPRPDFMGRRDRRERDDGAAETNRGPRFFSEANFEQRRADREVEFEARLATMTPEEREKALEDRQRMEELRNLPPEQRQQQIEQMIASQPDMRQRMEQRMASGLKNSTPEQRVERARRMAEMRAQRDQRRRQENR